MKTNSYKFIVVILSATAFILQFESAYSQMALVREWASVAGYTDSTFKTPMIHDKSYTYVATSIMDSSTGSDIYVVLYDSTGDKIWDQTWNGTGNGRDIATAMVDNKDYLYLCGATYSSSLEDYDFVTMKIDKLDGSIEWVSVFNGTASLYDIATAIDVYHDDVFVTGAANNNGTMLDYMTIKYKENDGSLSWSVAYDNNGFMDIPFNLEYKNGDIAVTGGSQNNIYEWDYATLEYDIDGNQTDITRVSGSSAGFDRAQSLKVDEHGNIYITGATAENGTGYDIKTVKIDSTGTVVWINTFDYHERDDIGFDLIVDPDENVYVCGKATNFTDEDMVILKLDYSDGSLVWSKFIDTTGYDEVGVKMCFDSHSNIVVAGKGTSTGSNADFLTAAFDKSGNEQWRDYFDGNSHGFDSATDITSDTLGNIYVSGWAYVDDEMKTVTIKYRTDYFTDLPQIDTPSNAYLFYPNYGQLIDMEDSSITDSVHYYTLHHFPQLYFGYGVMNMAWSHIDSDTSTADTIQRVDVSFFNSINPTQALHPDMPDSSGGYINYFLAHCPNGITNVYGYNKIIFKEVYENIDAIYTSNNAGLKLFFICNPGSAAPDQIGLQFDGQDGISINQNWELVVNTSLGEYALEKPRIYQLDSNNNIISLPWHLNWAMPQSDVAMFSGWGTIDNTKALIIEVGRSSIQTTPGCDKNLCWCTYYGGVGEDKSYSTCVDPNGFIYQVGTTNSQNFPNIPNQSTLQHQLGFANHSFNWTNDAFIIKYKSTGTSNAHNNIRWLTYYGGNSEDVATSVGYSTAGVNNTIDVYFAGWTNSSDFPTEQSSYTNTTPPAPSYTPYNQPDLSQGGGSLTDGFIVRLNQDGDVKRWATFIGGDNSEKIYGLTVSDKEDLYVVGETNTDQTHTTYHFPIFNSINADSYNQSDIFTTDDVDGFIMRFNKFDERLWSTYYGGEQYDKVTSICMLDNDKVAVTGGTYSTTATTITASPSTANSLGQFPICGTSTNVVSATNHGESDAIVAVFNDLDQLIYSTFYGGTGIENGTWSSHQGAVVRTSNGEIASTNPPTDNFYVIGTTTSESNILADKIQLVNSAGSGTNTYFQEESGGGSDIFIARFSNLILEHSTYFGGNGDETSGGIAVNTNGEYFFSGNSELSTGISTGCTEPTQFYFPLCDYGVGVSEYYDAIYNDGLTDAFFAALNNADEIVWSTYIGGEGPIGNHHSNEIINSISLVNNTYIYFGGYSDAYDPHPFPQIEDINRALWWQNSMSGSPGQLNDAIIGRFEMPILVGIDEISKKNLTISIYPNPTPKYLFIELSANLNKSIKLVIYSILGQSVYQQQIDTYSKNSKIEVDVSSLKNGIYCVQLNIEGKVLVEKFIKQ